MRRDAKIRAYNLEKMAKKKRLEEERKESNLLMSDMLSVMSRLCINPDDAELLKELEDVKLAQLVSDNVIIELQKDHDRAEAELSRFISQGV